MSLKRDNQPLQWTGPGVGVASAMRPVASSGRPRPLNGIALCGTSEPAMDEHRKSAYRYLLYWALLEIRGVEWITYRPLRLLNPFLLRKELKRVSRAGALADWLHNLAQISGEDFRDFNEEWFWRDYDSMVKRHGDPWNYRGVFDRRLEELGRPAGAT